MTNPPTEKERNSLKKDLKTVITTYNTKFRVDSSKTKNDMRKFSNDIHNINDNTCLASNLGNKRNYEIGIKIIKKDTISPSRMCLITSNDKITDISHINPTKSFEMNNVIGDMLNFGGKSRNAQRNTLGLAKSTSILNTDKIQQSNSYSDKNQMYSQILKSINIAKSIKMPKTIKSNVTVLKKVSDDKNSHNHYFNSFASKQLSIKNNTTSKGIHN
jgi:hypothetical protein